MEQNLATVGSIGDGWVRAREESAGDRLNFAISQQRENSAPSEVARTWK
jgi:hypothetical protein